ncbi:hypothetical protein [Pseudoalteromonas sp. T1lg23B]|uniref:hypothetical protein n=1 Tax=Pseudoalteromonas sp. T1lg23B TaxID=2077097 RepID=UPI001319C7F4|nr:hypothetical protein [Pseudoalteromonas sp. T1lg23B]
MKTSIKLKIKAKKLKELSQVQAQQVAGGTNDGSEPPAAKANYWQTFCTCKC